jgi:ferrous iron transport protein A
MVPRHRWRSGPFVTSAFLDLLQFNSIENDYHSERASSMPVVHVCKPGLAPRHLLPRPMPDSHCLAVEAGALPVDGAAACLAPFALDTLAAGMPAVVRSVTAPPTAPEWAQWLDEIGFFPGERVMVMARGLPGGDPLVVRVGNSTFALRRAEAACIALEPVAR